MEDNEAPQAGPAQASPLEVSQSDAAKTAYDRSVVSPTARARGTEGLLADIRAQRNQEGGFRSPLNIDELAERVKQATVEELPRVVMEFYDANAARLRKDMEEYTPGHDTPENRMSLAKWENVAKALHEQLGEPKLPVSVGEIVKGAPANSPRRVIYHPLK